MLISRRKLISASAAFCTYALVREAQALVPMNVSMSAVQWTKRQTELAHGLASGSISQSQWHEAVNGLAREVDIEDLARMIRRASAGAIRKPELKEPARRFIHIATDDGEQRLPYSVAVFDFAEGGVIAPHAHKNMASAHMVMDGSIRIRTYDRVADRAGSLIIRPTGDAVAETGHAAAMTPENDNVHWFLSNTRRAMTVDVVIADLDKTATKPYEIQPVDAIAAVELTNGDLNVPLISFEESRKKYHGRL